MTNAPQPIADERIAEIEARTNAATPGPWTDKKPSPDKTTGFSSGVIVAAVAPRQGIYASPPGGSCPAADQRFIAHAREDIPYLLIALRAALARVAAVEHEMKAAKERMWECGKAADEAEARLATATAAIERLREALRLCGDLADNSAGHETSRLDGIKRNARAALSTTEPTT